MILPKDSKLTVIGAMAFANTKLTSFEMPNSVETIEAGAFIGCKEMKEIKLSENLKVIDAFGFNRCEKLEALNFGNKLTKIGEFAFSGCEKILEVVLPDSLESIGHYAFVNCGSLEKVTIPEGVVKIGKDAFASCGKIYSYTILNADCEISYLDGAKEIYGHRNSTAQEYAKANGVKFYVFGEELPDEELPKKDVTEVFSDVKNGWYKEYVQYVYDHGLMNGSQGTTEFRPTKNISKAQVVQVLYNMENQPVVQDRKVFEELTDVYEGKWYADAIAWAYSTGVVTGDTSKNIFSPNADVTREQLAVMMYRYAEYKGYDIQKTSDFAGLQNADKVKNWAVNGVKWAVGSGLISGVEKDGVKDLVPQGNATRAQVLYNFIKTD